MSGVRNTSLLAWAEVEPHLGEKQQIVYALFTRLGPMTNAEAALVLGWSINRVTPRVLELRKSKEGLLFFLETRHCTVTGRLAHVWCSRGWRRAT